MSTGEVIVVPQVVIMYAMFVRELQVSATGRGWQLPHPARSLTTEPSTRPSSVFTPAGQQAPQYVCAIAICRKTKWAPARVL